MKKFFSSILGFHLTIMVGLGVMFYFNNLEENYLTIVNNFFLGLMFVSVLLSVLLCVINKRTLEK